MTPALAANAVAFSGILEWAQNLFRASVRLGSKGDWHAVVRGGPLEIIDKFAVIFQMVGIWRARRDSNSCSQIRSLGVRSRDHDCGDHLIVF